MSTALTPWFTEIVAFIDDRMALAIGLYDTNSARTSTRTTAGEHSSGLGLAICKRMSS